MKKLFNKLQSLDFFQTFRHASTYFMAQLMVQGLGVISLRVFTGLMDPSESGVAQLFLSLGNVATVLFSLNIASSVGRYYFEPEGRSLGRFIGTMLLLLMATWAVLFAALWIGWDFLFSEVGFPKDVFPYFCLFVAGEALWQIYIQLGIARKQSQQYAVMVSIMAYLKFGISVALLYAWGGGYLGKVAGDGLAYLIMVPIGLWYLYKMTHAEGEKMSLKWHTPDAKYMLWLGVPLLPYLLGNHLLNAFDQLMISASLGSHANGLYAFAYKVGSLLMMGLNTALINAAAPDFFRWRQSEEHSAIASQEQSLLKFQVLGAATLAFFAYDLGYWLTAREAYREGLHITPVIVTGYLFMGFYYHYGRHIFFLKKNGYVSLITLTAGALNVLLNLIFIPRYGYQAAAWTTLASFAFMPLAGWLVCDYFLKIKELPTSRILNMLPMTFLVFPIAIYFGYLGWHWWLVPIKLAMVGGLGLWLFGDKLKAILGRV